MNDHYSNILPVTVMSYCINAFMNSCTVYSISAVHSISNLLSMTVSSAMFDVAKFR